MSSDMATIIDLLQTVKGGYGKAIKSNIFHIASIRSIRCRGI
jgi:hypothetical protein